VFINRVGSSRVQLWLVLLRYIRVMMAVSFQAAILSTGFWFTLSGDLSRCNIGTICSQRDYR